jgi:hypothetical protein
MCSRKARNKLIPSKDNNQRKTEEPPRILSSEYRHSNRIIEIRTPSSELSVGIVRAKTKNRPSLHVAGSITIDQPALCSVYSAGIRR